jgi:hypothetical protein
MPFLVFVAVLALTACGGGDKSTVDLPGGGQAEIGKDDGGITIEGPSGTVQIGQAELPDGWPADFPLPDDAKPVYSVAVEDGVSVWFTSGQSIDDLKAFFTEALPAAGYEVGPTTEFGDANGSYAVVPFSGNGSEGAVYLGSSSTGAAPGYTGEFDFWVALGPAS